ncbi:MAG: arginine--tRNA ligase [Methanobacteriota archaeon]
MNDPILSLRDSVGEAVQAGLAKLEIPQEHRNLPLEAPPEGMGDIAVPCHRLAKLLRRNPVEIAKSLDAAIGQSALFTHAPAGPYVNFTFDSQKMARATLEALAELRDRYGTLPPKGLRVILEHTSVNPTDRLSVGRGRNPIIGDTLARIMRAAGYSVETQYYVDDMGRQAAMKTLAVRHGQTYQWAAAATGEREGESPGDPALKEELASLVSGAEHGDKAVIDEMIRICSNVMGETISPTLRRIGAEVDSYVSESKFVVDGSVGRTLDALRGGGLPDENGALYIDLENHGISGRSSKYFLSRTDGTSLYAARDVAYHQWKLSRCDRAVNVLGEDHKLEAKGVEIGLRLLGSEKVPEVLFYAFVSLPEGKMSTRAGRVVLLDDLLDEAIVRAQAEVEKRRPELPEDKKREIATAVGIASVRYNIVRVQAEKPMVFKWEEALNFEGCSAPFIQYAHARACSILARASNERPAPPPSGRAEAGSIPSVLESGETRLVRAIAQMPSVVSKCAEDKTPHALASYALQLASEFNQFYRDCPVITAEPEVREFRIALAVGARWALASALGMLGLAAPAEM